MSFAIRKQLKNLSVLLTGDRKTLDSSGCLTFEQDLYRYHFMRRGNYVKQLTENVLTWEMELLPLQQVVCYTVAKILSRCVQLNETGSHDEKKNACRNSQQQTKTLEYVSVRTEKQQT